MCKYLPLVIFLLTVYISAQTTRNVPAQYTTIQSALNAAQSGDTVLVQPGTYSENLTWPSINGIKLFAVGDTGNTIIDGRNLSTIIYMSTTGVIDTSTLIKGFALINGGNVTNGGGIFIDQSSPKIENCLIRDCSEGGAIYLLNSQSSLYNLVVRNIVGTGIDCRSNSNSILRNIRISNCYNKAHGIYCDETSSPIISDAIIENNNNDEYDGGVGGAGIATRSELILENVIIRNNIAQLGAGVRVLSGSITINNSIISNNIATRSDFGGGGLYGCSITLRNTKIIGNVASNGGGVYSLGYLIVENCTFSDNIANNNGGGLYLKNECYYGTSNISNTTFSRNIALTGAALYFSSNIYNLSKPLIQNSTFTENRGISTEAIYCNYAALQMQGSNFVNNSYAIYNNTNAVTVQVINNWWGDQSGPNNSSQNITGKGDTISNFVNLLPFLNTPDTSAPPIPVQNVIITGSNQNSISIAWDSSFIGDLSGYRIYYDNDSNAFPYANKIDVGNVTSYTISSLITENKYYFKVTCYDIGNNESWYSKTINAITTPAARISMMPQRSLKFST